MSRIESALLIGSTILSCVRSGSATSNAFERCAMDVGREDAKAAEWIRQGSTHWLRHTRGVGIDLVQANLGHENPATTAIFVRAEKGRRHWAVQEAFGGEPRT